MLRLESLVRDESRERESAREHTPMTSCHGEETADHEEISGIVFKKVRKRFHKIVQVRSG
jgi:hypothetical protein